MAERFKKLTLRQRFLIAPLAGLVLLGLLMAAFIHESQSQNALLLRVAENDLAAFSRYSAVFIDLSEQHMALHDLLNSAQKMDEGRLYDKAKNALYGIQDSIVAIEKTLPAATQGRLVDEKSAKLRREVLALIQAYNNTVTSAVDLTTLKAPLAPARLALANDRFIDVNRAFSRLLDHQRQGLVTEIKSGVNRSRATSVFFAVTGISVAALLLALSLLLSRLLSRSLEEQIDVLSQLGATTQAGGDVVDRIGEAISTFRRTQQDLQEREARYRELVELSPDAIFIQSEGRIAFVNSACMKLLGATSPAQLVGKNVTEITHPDFRDQVKERMRLIVEDPELRVRPFPHTKVRLDGTPVHVEVTAAPFIHMGKRGAQVVMRDITERIRAEQELAKTTAELEKFALVASHDLQEPLRTTANAAILLEERHGKKLDGDAKELLAFIVSGVMHMRQLINGLLVFSRIGSEPPAAKVATDCGAVLADVLTHLRAAIDESGAAIEHGPLPTVRVDPSQLDQVLMNLISNAIKFRSTEPLKIRIDAMREGPDWVISLADNGIGINPAYSDKIFEIFERLHNVAAYPGTGVGLAICKKIVEGNNGRIWVESAEGKGAKFSFTIAAAA
jgi:PAS domain S-box-containing protein